MGIESAVCHYMPVQSVEKIGFILLSCGAVSEGAEGLYEKWVIKSEAYWIDFMKGKFGSGDEVSLSIRIAVTNKLLALEELRKVAVVLMKECGGYLTFGNRGTRITPASEENWVVLNSWFIERQRNFFQLFGEHYVAISGADVFEFLRKGRKA